MSKDETLFKGGDRIADRYTILEFIGAGGVGEVYKVEDGQGNISCCKVLKPRVVPSFVKIDKIETLLIDNVPALPGVLRPGALFEHEGKRFIISDFFEGTNFRTLINDAALDNGVDLITSCTVVDRILYILSAFPPLSVHGMLKPSNVIISNVKNGKTTVDSEVVITDFGAGRILSFSKFASIQLSRGRDYYYLAPEFVSQGGRVKRAADIYALGVMLFEALSGQIPKKDLKFLTDVVPDINKSLSEVVKTALNKQPEKRYQEFGMMRQALRDAIPEIPEYVPLTSKSEKKDVIETEDIFTIGERDIERTDHVEVLDIFEGVEPGDLDEAVEILNAQESPTSKDTLGQVMVEQADDQKELSPVERVDGIFDAGYAEIPTEGQEISMVDGVDAGTSLDDGDEGKLANGKTISSPPRVKTRSNAWQWVLGAILVIAIAAAIIIKFYLLDPSDKSIAPPPTPIINQTPISTTPAQPATDSIPDKAIEPAEMPDKVDSPAEKIGLGESSDEEKITLLVDKGEKLKSSGKLTSPSDDCLFSVVSQIESIDPENGYAKSARKFIVKKYTSAANELIGNRNWQKATSVVNSGLVVDPESERLKSLLARIESEMGEVVPGECPEGMTLVSSGTLRMGSARDDKQRRPGEFNNEPIFVAAFCIDKFEYPNTDGQSPSTSVTWEEATTSCKGGGKRLCSEKEWERACKGPDNSRYPYGNEFNASICNTADVKGLGRHVMVAGGMKSCRSGFGIFDLSGNVKEWTASKIAPGTRAFVIKGGSSVLRNVGTRCAMREFALPDETSSFLGFRCCSDA